LLNFIPHALHGAIKEFNRGKLRYSWLPYLPFRPDVSDFFQRVEEETLDLLHRSPILESFAGELTPPRNLTHVPESFTDKDGKPLILTQSTKSKYLSHKYPSRDLSRLLHLGVGSLSTESFIEDLRSFISGHPDDYQGMPEKWHSRLAEVLVSSIIRNKLYRDAFSALKIVPLRDGQWASSNSGSLLLPSRSESFLVPKGINVLEIDPRADTDYFRRELFVALGAKEFQAERICGIIIRIHEEAELQPNTLSTSDLISQLVFLYETGWKNAERRDIWFTTESGSYCRGSQVYMDSDVPYSAKSMFAQNRAEIPFLHQDYYKAFSSITAPSKPPLETGGWQEWLAEHMNVAQIPRLAAPPIGAPFSTSRDFQFLLNTHPSTELLLLIRHHWNYYSRWVVHKERRIKAADWDISQEKIRDKISYMEVKCRHGLVKPLNQTFLPLSSMKLEKFVSVPFLDVPEPDNDQWDYLKHFGVVVELDAVFFVEYLRRLKNVCTSREQVSKLYEQIGLWTTGDNAGAIRYVSMMAVFVLNFELINS
jgi:hypothetical protein